MEQQEETKRTRGGWSTRKKEKLPRGVYRHPSGDLAVRFTCGAGHIHKQRVGPLKSEAVRTYHERRNRAQREPGWCPDIERRLAHAAVQAERAREAKRMTFGDYADTSYSPWAKLRHRGYRTTSSQVNQLKIVFGRRMLDEITTADIEQHLARIESDGLAPATVNRYRDRLSAMFKRAVRLALVKVNPVTGIEKHKEPGGRIAYLPAASAIRSAYEEEALRAVLPEPERHLFVVSVHTGLRWSEQKRLRWADVDVLSRTITVPQSKHGESRTVPMNSVVQAVVVDIGARRRSPGDPEERVFTCRYTEASKFFPQAVERASATLAVTGKDASRLDGYTWHGNRHTFASRLIMAGVDLRTVQELGGWKTLKMVQRYAHLSPDHLRAAVERLVVNPGEAEPELSRK